MALGSLFIMGCKKEETEGRIMVRLTDAPAAYQQVNVEILKVRVHMSNGSWTDLPTNSGVYNLLSLQNGIDTTIVNTTQLPAGDITQMRLVLGSNNTLMADSVTYPLTVPSGSESGIKLVGGLSIPGNSTLNVLIDFDANQSIVQGGNGDYQLKPVIKVVQ